jgi:small subunit ribosomal protein S1
MTEELSDDGGAFAPTKEEFAAMLDETLGTNSKLEGTVVKGTVVAIENDAAIIDVGLKAEGRVDLKEFSTQDDSTELKVGDTVEVYLDRMENASGEAVLSREKARREESWTQLEKAFNDNQRTEGVIFGRVKGGFTVDLSGAVAFLPGSQVDVRPVRDITPLLGIPQPFQILKMDRRRGNIVVSRRAVLEETRAADRAELISTLTEGQIIDGVVKNITDYGAFVDLGGVDGLLHVTDMAWRRINHPSEVLSIGETLKVQIIRLNPETQRISLGMKQLLEDPWDGVEAKYPKGTKFTGRVTNITDYGAFVELEPGVEGLVHVSEMSWTKKNVHPGKIVSTSQEVEVMVLEVDPNKRRISLGLKQCSGNPWQTFADEHAVGTHLQGEIKNVTEFGLFIGLDNGVDGMVHMSDLDWSTSGEAALAKYKKGDVVEAAILDVDINKERISLGIKQLQADPFESVGNLKKGSVVTATVAAITDGGIEVTLGDGAVIGFVQRNALSRDRAEQRPDRFAVGDRVDAVVTNIDRASRKVSLSIKARETQEEKQAVEAYGSSDSGASLGDILGAAMNKARAEKSKKEPAGPEEPADRQATPETEGDATPTEAPSEDATPVAEDATPVAEGVTPVAEEASPAAEDEKKKPAKKAAKTTKTAAKKKTAKPKAEAKKPAAKSEAKSTAKPKKASAAKKTGGKSKPAAGGKDTEGGD